MRIRKHSIAVLSASAGRSASTGEEEEERKRKEFLLPLVAAVATTEGDNTRTPLNPPHNWRNSLLRFSLYSEAAQVVRERQKAKHGWNGIMSTNRERKRSVLPSEGITVKKHKSSSFEHTISKLYGKQELRKSGHCEKTSMWRGREHNLREKEKRHEGPATIFSVNHGRKDGTKESTHNYKHKLKTDNKKKNNNEHVGSQCRRRNGRGWQCSERTLVGYSLCEHHLGKDRFKSLNGSNGVDKVSMNNKGNKFKELRLIQAAVSCKVEFL